ncbi:MAG TPA: HigA family addiction module antitoxin [Propionicimonas sp.]|nr:HigA family addiction module antitoxin [Propionicimonas sp.]HQA78556.1 HigA family addiction module antitoxin [Propionicimonas sp.]HQD97790.1 HigA family addiction module antitoxin [Propionicimonas sp.]
MDELKPMHNPPHPGEFITEVYLTPFGVSARQLAARLEVSPSTLTRLLSGASRVSPEMALRLSKVLGRSAESWLAMQDAHDLWKTRRRVDLTRITRLELAG